MLRKRKMHQPFLYNVAVDSVIVSVKVTVIQICNASFALSFLENNKVYNISYLSCFRSLLVSLKITKFIIHMTYLVYYAFALLFP